MHSGVGSRVTHRGIPPFRSIEWMVIVIVLGIVLIVLGLLVASLHVLFVIGIVLLVLGLILNFVPIGGTRRRFY